MGRILLLIKYMANVKITLGNNTPWPKPGLLHLPSDYNTNTTKKYPLFFFIGGMWQADNVDSLDDYGPSYLVSKGNKMEFNIDGVIETPIVISIAPGQYPPASYIKSVLEEIYVRYRVDKDRVTLTGLSMGGQIVTLVALSYPTLASFVFNLQGVDVGGGMYPKGKDYAIAGGKAWIVEGGAPEENRGGESVVEAMNTAVPGSAEFTSIPAGQPGYTHCCWNTMYDPSFKNKAGKNWMEVALSKKGTIIPIPEPEIPVKKLLVTLVTTTNVYTDGSSETSTTKS